MRRMPQVAKKAYPLRRPGRRPRRPHRSGPRPVGVGHDPWHAPRRSLREPRYDALETRLDRTGWAGRHVMCTSASVQVCPDAGHEEPGPLGHGRRWSLAHQLGPVLVAAFANCPLVGLQPTGWKSTRQLLWMEIGPGRAAAPTPDGNPRAAWARHVMDAPVICIRRDTGPWDVPDGLTFRQWVRSKTPRLTTREDLDYHLTTLFPPVRPRGHLELRMIDAQPGEDGWIVPLAVTATLFDDPEAAETAYRAVKPLAESSLSRPAPQNPLWADAARIGLGDDELREAAALCFRAALEALPRIDATTEVTDAVAAYLDRYVTQGRCPADDLLDQPRDRVDPRSGLNPTGGTARAHGKDIHT